MAGGVVANGVTEFGVKNLTQKLCFELGTYSISGERYNL